MFVDRRCWVDLSSEGKSSQERVQSTARGGLRRISILGNQAPGFTTPFLAGLTLISPVNLRKGNSTEQGSYENVV